MAMLLQQFLPDRGMARFSRWMLGSISEETPWALLALIGALTVAGAIAASLWGPKLDAATLADDEARSVGVNPHRVRTLCFGIAGVLTAGTVLLAGPVGFVGLVCPHIARILLGASHRRLVVGSALVGVAFVSAAEVVSVGVGMWTASSDTLVSTGRIPVGIISALIGAPIFIAMLLTGMRSRLSSSEGI
jgi:iron complex transport system permease protein